jgi:hypothetical protein
VSGPFQCRARLACRHSIEQFGGPRVRTPGGAAPTRRIHSNRRSWTCPLADALAPCRWSRSATTNEDALRTTSLGSSVRRWEENSPSQRSGRPLGHSVVVGILDARGRTRRKIDAESQRSKPAINPAPMGVRPRHFQPGAPATIEIGSDGWGGLAMDNWSDPCPPLRFHARHFRIRVGPRQFSRC